MLARHGVESLAGMSGSGCRHSCSLGLLDRRTLGLQILVDGPVAYVLVMSLAYPATTVRRGRTRPTGRSWIIMSDGSACGIAPLAPVATMKGNATPSDPLLRRNISMSRATSNSVRPTTRPLLEVLESARHQRRRGTQGIEFVRELDLAARLEQIVCETPSKPGGLQESARCSHRWMVRWVGSIPTTGVSGFVYHLGDDVRESVVPPVR